MKSIELRTRKDQKKIKWSRRPFFALLFSSMLCLPLMKLRAQPTVVLPHTPDNIIWSTGEPFNTAMYSYAPVLGGPPNQCVFGVAWHGGAPIYVKDLGTGLSATTPPHSGGTIPDVIIGNKTSILTHMNMAVAYYDYIGHVVIDFYDINGAGTMGLTVTYHSSASIPVAYTVGVLDFNTVHLDLIANHAPLPSTQPCDTFIVTWDDLTDGSVYAAMGNLTSHSITTAPVLISNSGTEPDVAAIQRNGMPGPDNVALITYIDPATAYLMYAEYDFTSASFIMAPSVRDMNGPFGMPRIDANDDYTSNLNPFIAQYKVVVEAPHLGSTLR